MGQVALLHDGRRLRLGPDADRRVCCTAGGSDADALFDRAELGHGRVALRAGDGRYLAVRPAPDLGYGLYPTDDLTADAAFEEIRWPDGQVSFRSCHLAYVSAAATGLVTVNRVEPGARERFTITPPPAPALPGQRRPAEAPAPIGATPHR